MASHFDIVDEEYIKELKDKSKNENTKRIAWSGERTVSKSGQMKETWMQIKKSTRQCPRPMIVINK